MIFATAVAEMLQVAVTATPVDRGARIEPRDDHRVPISQFCPLISASSFVDAGLDGGQVELPNRSTPVLEPSSGGTVDGR
jgi:hypothetical protein